MLTALANITAILMEAGKAKTQREAEVLEDSRVAGKTPSTGTEEGTPHLMREAETT